MNIMLEPGRTAWDLKWKMLGVPVRVHPLFWLISLALSYNQEIRFPAVLLVMACMFVSIMVHEFGHALSHRHYGSRDMYVVLYHMGGLCISSGTPRHWPRIMSLLWGPGAGFLLGIPAYIAGAIVFGPKFPIASVSIQNDTQYYLIYMFDALVWINLVWGCVNLLPVFPLDGGQICREWIHWKRPSRGDRYAFTISFYMAIVVAVVSLVLFLYSGSRDGRNLLPTFFFGSLAYSSYSLRRQLAMFGDMEDEGPRQPWEQDADWWKK